MTINRDFFGSFSSCIRIGLTGFLIITVVVLSLTPIYIKDRSVEVPLSTPTVYLLSNLTFYVDILSISEARVIPSSVNISALTLGTLQTIENQLNNNFATIKATSIITAAGYRFDVSELIVSLKIQFYKPCVEFATSCEQRQQTLIKDILNKLGPLNINGQCYSDCSSPAHNCSFLATPSSSTSAFTLVSGSNANSVAVEDPCSTSTTTVRSTATVTSTSTGRVNVTQPDS